VIRRKKEPRWGLKDWTKHAYASDIPLLRAALSRWCALVEAAHCGALAPAAAAAAAAGPIPDPRNPFVGDPALTRDADGVPATELKQIVLPEALAPLAGLEAPMAAAAAYIFPKSSRAFTCLASLRATEPLPPQLRVPPRTRGSAPGGGELVTINFASFRPIPRFNYRDMSYAVFQATYERPLLPCLISGMTEGWAMNEYTGTSLSTGKYRNCRLKIGKCPDGYRLTAKLKHFMQYLYTQHDDQPLYLFESQLEVIPVAEEMQQDYTRPNFFQTDFFDSVAFSRRPPQRWLCIGAQGSGSFMHKDPLNTNAWNALVQGRKYWVLLSPNVPASLATGAQFERRYNGEGPSSWAPPQGWFTHTLPQLRAAIAEANAGGAGYVLYEVMHFPGETIFVPGNWWHAVWNLDDTLAITQNYVNESNFDDVWPLTRGRRKHMAARWLAAMDKDAPAAAARARELDARDGFKAVFSKGSLRRKAERRARIAAKQARTAAAIAAAAGAGAGAEAKDAGKEENKKAEEDDDDHASDEEPSGEWDSSTNSDDTE
jgi:histone arginine demethylase JMJD6